VDSLKRVVRVSKETMKIVMGQGTDKLSMLREQDIEDIVGVVFPSLARAERGQPAIFL
jgi:hypothetical protein